MTLPTEDLDYSGSHEEELDYHALNAKINLTGPDGKLQLEEDKKAARQFFLTHVNQNTVYFTDLEEKLEYLVDNGYYEEDVIEQYSFEFVKSLFKRAYAYKFRFETFLGAFKYYTSYTLKTFDGKRYLERFEDRVTMTALYLARGDEDIAEKVLDEIMTGRYQPATPTFLNAGKAQRGELVSCFPAGTPVDTIDGQVNIEDITVGTQVLSHDGVYHEVTELIENNNLDNLVAIKHYGHKKSLVSTPNHPILVWTTRAVESLTEHDGADVENGFVWLEAQDVQAGDYIVSTYPTEVHETQVFDLMNYIGNDETIIAENGTIKKLNVDKKLRNTTPYSKSFTEINQFVEENYDLGLIVGWYLSEGHVSKRKNSKGETLPNGVHFTLGTHEKTFQTQLAQAFKDVFAVEAKIVDSYYDGSTKISVHSRAVAEFMLSLVGTGFNNKKLTQNIITANHEFQTGMMHGLFRGDGHTTNGALSLDMVNPELIDTLQQVLSRLGIISRVRTYTNMAGNLTGQLSVPGTPGENEEFILNTAKNLQNYVGLRGGRKNFRGTDFYTKINGRIVYEVANVEITQEIPEKVYNLEVADTHTYSIRGTVVHNCFLMSVEDNMESIARSITNSLQLSKRGGGVALNLTNIREMGAPIKKIQNQSSGVVPVMKMLEDSFSYANQLGARQGAGAVYLNAHHPDIMRFLDTKRENADEKIRIKTLSLGVVIPDVTFELAKNNDDMYLFSPYDVEKVYKVPFAEVNVTDKYNDMVNDKRIRKTKIKARQFFQTIAEIQFESGYPYILFEDTANKSNPIDGKIKMSNLCSEILQVSETATFNEDGTYNNVGKDISCNLGSLNVAKAFDSPDFALTIETAIRSLSAVSDLSNISSVPSIENGNKRSHAIGLGQMNLHGFFAREHIHYDSPEAIDFTNLYFYAVLFQCLTASNKIAKERGEVFDGFERSDYAGVKNEDGTYTPGKFFNKYIEKDWSVAETEKIANLMRRSAIYLPKPEDWVALGQEIAEHGIYNQNLQAIPPTGSISYINNSTSSIHPIAAPIEAQEGKIGRVYYPSPYLSDDTLPYYRDAYKLGPNAIIDVYAAATQHVDQGLSLTLFYPDTVSTRDLNKAYIYAWRKGIKTLYMRIKNSAVDREIEGLASSYCESCQL